MPLRSGVRPRVLIPTDEPCFTLGLVEGYRSLGWEVVTGTNNFRIRAAEFDVVHYQWPEEHCEWGVPSRSQLDEIQGHLRWWQERATTIATVHNPVRTATSATLRATSCIRCSTVTWT
jgi:hypothetical protein